MSVMDSLSVLSDELTKWRNRAVEIDTERTGYRLKCEKLEAERDRLRAVVDAAKTWRDARRKPKAGFSTGADQESWDALHEAEAKFWTALAALGEGS